MACGFWWSVIVIILQYFWSLLISWMANNFLNIISEPKIAGVSILYEGWGHMFQFRALLPDNMITLKIGNHLENRMFTFSFFFNIPEPNPIFLQSKLLRLNKSIFSLPSVVNWVFFLLHLWVNERIWVDANVARQVLKRFERDTEQINCSKKCNKLDIHDYSDNRDKYD